MDASDWTLEMEVMAETRWRGDQARDAVCWAVDDDEAQAIHLVFNCIMSNYPPPPLPDHQHYTALYPTAARTQHLLGTPPQSQAQYGEAYAKATANVNVNVIPGQPTPNNQMQIQAFELQQQAVLGEQQRQQMQQAPPLHPIQIHPSQFPTPPTQYLPQDETADEKKDRQRKACDGCSIRKVKCDASGPPCRACRALDIPCTFDRPTRRRGPPNKHAEAFKRRKVGDARDPTTPARTATLSPSSPTHAAQALASLSSQLSGPTLTAEAICSADILNLLIDDFFTYIHPLCPFPHEPTFREAWRRREDVTNKSFLALLASMIGALVSSFPRKPRLHLKAQKKQNLFPNHMSLVYKCQEICAAARGPGYLESENLNIYDAATSYFLGLMGVYTFRSRLGRLYFAECLTIIRSLGLHKAKDQRYTNLGALSASVGSHGANVEGSREQIIDNITLEMGRRIFWTMFVTVKTMQQLGSSFSELVIPPPTPSEPYPPYPTEVDDFCIYATGNEPQPAGLLSMLAGFNANVKVFNSYTALHTMEMAWGIDSVVDWERQKRVLLESLQRCKAEMNDLPQGLIVQPRAPFSEAATDDINNNQHASFAQSNMARDPAHSLLDPNQRNMAEESPEERRRIQYEIQKANIYASSLSTRSYIVEKYFNLCEAHARMRAQSGSLPNSPSTGIIAAGIDGMLPKPPTSNVDTTEQEMHEERESIVKDLLVVLYSINQVNMEPSADSFTMKIRSIASTLLDSPDQRKGQVALQAQQYLAEFLKILVKLERVSPANSANDQPEDEEAELRHWVDLREYQLKFAQQGGLFGMS
ncbi:Hypothetical protein R9X50_00291400 [Acrodontium crateriforme]|uniref:Zn(2)-C6 fungal-type domain-containing protein n=1 Tax=Acrodontium crateriforme TaxID=150365 RepID=A0AAQ3R907_9PEZI|nr:Hypothetical protein R9X50_00291400 [Acrodontium crateriforme]